MPQASELADGLDLISALAWDESSVMSANLKTWDTTELTRELAAWSVTPHIGYRTGLDKCYMFSANICLIIFFRRKQNYKFYLEG